MVLSVMAAILLLNECIIATMTASNRSLSSRK